MAQISRGNRGHARLGNFLDFNSLKSPFLGFSVIKKGHWPLHSPRMKPFKSADYFIKVNFHIVEDTKQGESKPFSRYLL